MPAATSAAGHGRFARGYGAGGWWGDYDGLYAYGGWPYCYNNWPYYSGYNSCYYNYGW